MSCARVNGDQDLDEAKACGARIVKVCKPWHIMFFIQSMEPGAATFFNACCCHADPAQGCIFGNILYAWLLMLTSVCIIGFLNSMAFGVGIYRKSE